MRAKPYDLGARVLVIAEYKHVAVDGFVVRKLMSRHVVKCRHDPHPIAQQTLRPQSGRTLRGQLYAHNLRWYERNRRVDHNFSRDDTADVRERVALGRVRHGDHNDSGLLRSSAIGAGTNFNAKLAANRGRCLLRARRRANR